MGRLEALARNEAQARVERRADGFEVRFGEARPRLRVFGEGADRIVAFFYKPSRLDFSHDRFSYGALFLYPSDPESASAAFRDGLRWLRDGLTPAGRPEGLKRSLSFTVPD